MHVSQVLGEVSLKTCAFEEGRWGATIRNRQFRHRLMSSYDDVVVALLLFVGLYLPSSSGGESSNLFFWLSRALSLIFLLYLAWKHGMRRGAVLYVSLPILILMSVCTLLNWPFRLQWGFLAA